MSRQFGISSEETPNRLGLRFVILVYREILLFSLQAGMFWVRSENVISVMSYAPKHNISSYE